MSATGVLALLAALVQAPAQQTPAAAAPATLTPAALQQAIDFYWNGEYERTLAVLTQGEFDADDRVEGLKYTGFSLVALGRNDDARARFRALLEMDPSQTLDEALVSPKIIEQFEQAKTELQESLLERGKAAYFDARYDEAYDLLQVLAKLGSASPIAGEYLQLARERIDLEKRTAALQPEVPAPTPADPNRVYNVGGDVSEPEATSQSPPRYPPMDLRNGVEGDVILRVVIDPKGEVKEADVLRGVNSRLDAEAVRAAHRWRYKPALRAGQPVAVYKIVAVRFRMTR